MGKDFTLQITQGSAKSSKARAREGNVCIELAGNLGWRQKARHVRALSVKALSKCVLPEVIMRVAELNRRPLSLQAGQRKGQRSVDTVGQLLKEDELHLPELQASLRPARGARLCHSPRAGPYKGAQPLEGLLEACRGRGPELQGAQEVVEKELQQVRYEHDLCTAEFPGRAKQNRNSIKRTSRIGQADLRKSSILSVGVYVS